MGPAIKHPFETLDLVVEAFRHALTPGLRQARLDCRHVVRQALGKAHQLGHPTRLGSPDPGGQGLTPAMGQHGMCVFRSLLTGNPESREHSVRKVVNSKNEDR